ncbi:WecB/TagA/CpsF family glycosyltransferase [Novosphingobium malaysiense]|uniref:Glycosyl transferase n=1 Tax=Novosphingobium malaysiense TaxID=1348853 RepID=A0A0B1ZL77_9SPHN|nr:WecB/TagA/CpsF family glycosyltransferase [Novosphingobium malaysiense]KHK90020.1 hypothetical protein LK12_19245 [Novosphingobium malaysiense]
MTNRLQILGMPIDRLPPNEFVDQFVDKAILGRSGYVCVPNVHQCILFHDELEHREIVNGADFVMSDSTVLQKFVARKYRLSAVPVLRGDQLMLALCRRAAAGGLPIALVGGKDDKVLARMVAELRRQCPGLEVVYAYSPPFRELSVEEEATMLAAILKSGAKMLFVGLGCPKQERWMARYSDRLPLMMIGVGAAFDFISGQVKTSPGWMHSAGLEWFHRLLSEPGRLWRRYLSTSPRFIWLYLTRDWIASLQNK